MKNEAVKTGPRTGDFLSTPLEEVNVKVDDPGSYRLKNKWLWYLIQKR